MPPRKIELSTNGSPVIGDLNRSGPSRHMYAISVHKNAPSENSSGGIGLSRAASRPTNIDNSIATTPGSITVFPTVPLKPRPFEREITDKSKNPEVQARAVAPKILGMYFCIEVAPLNQCIASQAATTQAPLDFYQSHHLRNSQGDEVGCQVKRGLR